MPTLGSKSKVAVTAAMREQLEQLCDLDSSEVRIGDRDLEFIDSVYRRISKDSRAAISRAQADWLKDCVERYLGD